MMSREKQCNLRLPNKNKQQAGPFNSDCCSDVKYIIKNMAPSRPPLSFKERGNHLKSLIWFPWRRKMKVWTFKINKNKQRVFMWHQRGDKTGRFYTLYVNEMKIKIYQKGEKNSTGTQIITVRWSRFKFPQAARGLYTLCTITFVLTGQLCVTFGYPEHLSLSGFTETSWVSSEKHNSSFNPTINKWKRINVESCSAPMFLFLTRPLLKDGWH